MGIIFLNINIDSRVSTAYTKTNAKEVTSLISGYSLQFTSFSVVSDILSLPLPIRGQNVQMQYRWSNYFWITRNVGVLASLETGNNFIWMGDIVFHFYNLDDLTFSSQGWVHDFQNRRYIHISCCAHLVANSYVTIVKSRGYIESLGLRSALQWRIKALPLASQQLIPKVGWDHWTKRLPLLDVRPSAIPNLQDEVTDVVQWYWETVNLNNVGWFGFCRWMKTISRVSNWT